MAKIQNLKIAELTPYANNPRINDSAVQGVVASIRKFGFIGAVIVNKDKVIINGHTRVKAMKELGADTIPAIVVDNLTPEQENALRIADNKTGEVAEWNMDLLKAELKALQEANFDMGALGFDTTELEELLGGSASEVGQTDPNEVPEVPETPVSKTGEVYKLGDHLLLCGDSTKQEDVSKIAADNSIDCWLTDPPYNVAYEGSNGLTIQNDSMEDTKFREFLRSAFACAEKAMKPGASFYIFHADSEGYNFRGGCYDVGLKVRECLVWKKNSLVLGRQDYQWIHEPCQIAGTMIRTLDGEKPIEELKDGDKIISFDTYSSSLKGLRDGVPIKTAQRQYSGELYEITVGGHKTHCTDNHEFSVRFNPKFRKNYCTYLMRRGDWWRVGHTTAYDARQFGLKSRCHQEKAEEAWIIECFNSRSDAQVAEQKLAVKYGIPYTHWETDRGFKNKKSNCRTTEQIAAIYEGLDLNKLAKHANRLLADYGRSLSFPFYIKGITSSDRISTRVTCRIASCNLIPGLMEVPVPTEGRHFDWMPIENITHEAFEGTVYSLAVKKWQHYIADGIITHNCLYGWKDGAAHSWYGDRAQTTVMEFNKPKKNDVHPTMKPTEMLVYLLKNSTKRGDVVLDTFGGSGSTIIACQQTGRKCRCIELDPKYCDVIRRRWAEHVHGEGCDWQNLTPSLTETHA